MNRHPCLEPVPNQPSLTSKKYCDGDIGGISRAQRTFRGSIASTLFIQLLLIGLLLVPVLAPAPHGGPGGGGPSVGMGEAIILLGLLALVIPAEFCLVIFTGSLSLATSREPAPNRRFAFTRGALTIVGFTTVFGVGLAIPIGCIFLLWH